MGNALGAAHAQYTYQQNPNNGNQQNNPQQIHSNVVAGGAGVGAGVGGNFIINLPNPPAVRMGGVVEPDNMRGSDLLGAIRNDLAAYFPFSRLVPPPPLHQTTSIKSLVNIHKPSISLRAIDIENNESNNKDGSQYVYQLQFVFDCLEPCDVVVRLSDPDDLEHEKLPFQIGPIHFGKGTGQMYRHNIDLSKFSPALQEPLPLLNSTEETSNNIVDNNTSLAQSDELPLPSNSNLQSTPLQPLHPLPPSSPVSPSSPLSPPSPLSSNSIPPFYPLVIELTCPEDLSEASSANKRESPVIRSQSTHCSLLVCVDNSLCVKVGQQTLSHQHASYRVHDIYGLDHGASHELDGRECCVCMSAGRDTLVLGCRHLCVCATCAEGLRMQGGAQNHGYGGGHGVKCPICRAPVMALLNIALSKDNTPVPSDKDPKDDEEDKEEVLLARRDKEKEKEKNKIDDASSVA